LRSDEGHYLHHRPVLEAGGQPVCMGRRPGVVRYAKAGSLNLEDLNRELIPLLNEPASAS
jgi:hypothetical protein